MQYEAVSRSKLSAIQHTGYLWAINLPFKGQVAGSSILNVSSWRKRALSALKFRPTELPGSALGDHCRSATAKRRIIFAPAYAAPQTRRRQAAIVARDPNFIKRPHSAGAQRLLSPQAAVHSCESDNLRQTKIEARIPAIQLAGVTTITSSSSSPKSSPRSCLDDAPVDHIS